jgi:hypothetical protein
MVLDKESDLWCSDQRERSFLQSLPHDEGTVMLLSSAADGAAPRIPLTSGVSQRIAIVRAGVALIWAAAFVIAVGDEIPHTGSRRPCSWCCIR